MFSDQMAGLSNVIVTKSIKMVWKIKLNYYINPNIITYSNNSVEKKQQQFLMDYITVLKKCIMYSITNSFSKSYRHYAN